MWRNRFDVTAYRVSTKTNTLWGRSKEKGSSYYKRSTVFIKRRPLTSFFIALGLLLFVLIIGNLFQLKKTEQAQTPPIKTVQVYGIGESPKATFQAKIEKSGVVKIMAQTGGVVQSVLVNEGDTVAKGQQIILLSSNYQGGNAPSVQREIAQTQYQNILDTFDKQKNLIQQQRDVATISAENAQRMRDIQRQSVDETNGLIDANQKQLDQMNAALQALIASDPTDQKDIQTDQATINQLQGAVDQLKQSERSVDYQSSNNNPPAQLANTQKDITLNQLDIQEKSLDLNKEVSRLQLSLAYINEAIMYPASPFAGTVQRVYVHEGQLVTPGTLLATVAADSIKATAILTVPQQVADILVQGEPSELVIDNKIVAVTPYFVSTQATDGQLYSVFYDVPEEYQQKVSDGEFVTVNVPVGKPKTTSTDPFIPIDAIYQTQDDAFVLVAQNGIAKTQHITVGKIFGNYVEVFSGIDDGDQVILDRNVVAGDRVKIQ